MVHSSPTSPVRYSNLDRISEDNPMHHREQDDEGYMNPVHHQSLIQETEGLRQHKHLEQAEESKDSTQMINEQAIMGMTSPSGSKFEQSQTCDGEDVTENMEDPILILDIKLIKDEPQKITIYEYDNPEDIVNQFCEKHSKFITAFIINLIFVQIWTTSRSRGCSRS